MSLLTECHTLQRLVVSPLGLQLTPRRHEGAGGWANDQTSTISLAEVLCWELEPAGRRGGKSKGAVAFRVVRGAEPEVLVFCVVADENNLDAAALVAILDGITMRFAVQLPTVAPSIYNELSGLLRANPLCINVAAASAVVVVVVPDPEAEAEGEDVLPPPLPRSSAVENSKDSEEGEAFGLRLARTFSMMDKHGSGHVSYVQFLSWWKARAKEAGEGGVSDETLRSSQLAFTEHDPHKNGTIELDELAALLRALDLLRFVAALPTVPPDAPTSELRIWNQRYDFRELLSAASVLSPDCCSWPAEEVPQWGFVHRRGLLEQGQDATAVAAETSQGLAGPARSGAGGLEAARDAAAAAREAVANPLRRLVAGDKSRFSDGDFELVRL